MCSKKFLDQCQSAITEIPAGERFALQLDGLREDKEKINPSSRCEPSEPKDHVVP